MSTVEMARAARSEGFYRDEPHEEREEIELFDEMTGLMEVEEDDVVV